MRYHLVHGYADQTNVVEGIMRERGVLWQERRLEEILFSNGDPTQKVQQIIRLGFDEEVASELVERHLIGSQMPAYYETLEFDPDYETSVRKRPHK